MQLASRPRLSDGTVSQLRLFLIPSFSSAFQVSFLERDEKWRRLRRLNDAGNFCLPSFFLRCDQSGRLRFSPLGSIARNGRFLSCGDV